VHFAFSLDEFKIWKKSGRGERKARRNDVEERKSYFPINCLFAQMKIH
jgi:hypothetical protein